MATIKSALSSVEFHNPQISSGLIDSSQPEAGGSKSPQDQLRCFVVDQTSYLKEDAGRDFLSSKDAAKRKRVNRIAKLKQCKLDARREQWLSQGSRCRPEEHKEAVQQATRKSGKNIPSKNTYVGKVATQKDSECHSRDVVRSDIQGEGNVVAKQIDGNFPPTHYLVGSVEGHSKIMQSLDVEENGTPPSLLRSSQEGDRCKNKRLGEAAGGACDSEEAQVRSKIYQSCCGASGNICCADNCCVPDLVSCGNENSQLRTESSVISLGRSAGGPKPLDEKVKVLYPKNREDTCTARLSTDQISCANNSFASGTLAETGPAASDLSLLHDSEDDWELAADALSGSGSSFTKITGKLPESSSEGKEVIEEKSHVSGVTNLQNGVLKPEYKFKAGGYGFKSRGAGGRAWRPDDVSRPPTLPSLSKQLSFQKEAGSSVWSGAQQISNPWGPPPVPSLCPICTEELDMTDSSFFPCSCGFRLCLFCHHRISSDDGRCPGCRKIYSPDVAMKLSRTTFWLSV